jgi:ceramide synthetase
MAAITSLLPLPPLDGSSADMLFCLYLGMAILALRVLPEKAAATALSRVLAAADRRVPPGKRSRRPLARRTALFLDNAFISLSSGIMVSWAWWVMMRANGGCTPATPRPCLEGWPGHPMSPEFRLVWLTIAGFYTYEMIGTLLRMGCVLSPDMVLHHLITMAMMWYGYYRGLHRFGMMATALFDASNPLLHAAKAINYADLPGLTPLKDGLFKCFALVFFLVRIVLPPFVLIYPGLTLGRVLPPATFAITNGLLIAVCSIQLFWFAKIVRIAMGGASEEEEEAAAGSRPATPTPKEAGEPAGAVKAD